MVRPFFFDEPIPEVHFMKLISCSLYNSWDTLKKESIAILRDKNGKVEKVSKFPPGHYNLENLKKVINGLFDYNEFEAQINVPEAMLKLNNFGEKGITIKGDFEEVSGNYTSIIKNNIKRLWIPTAYFIHCDLIDRNFNFVNNKKSDLLAKIDVRGKAYEKVRYDASPQ